MMRSFRDWIMTQLARDDLTPERRAYFNRLLAILGR